jgi:hypothetical protein
MGVEVPLYFGVRDRVAGRINAIPGISRRYKEMLTGGTDQIRKLASFQCGDPKRAGSHFCWRHKRVPLLWEKKHWEGTLRVPSLDPSLCVGYFRVKGYTSPFKDIHLLVWCRYVDALARSGNITAGVILANFLTQPIFYYPYKIKIKTGFITILLSLHRLT